MANNSLNKSFFPTNFASGVECYFNNGPVSILITELEDIYEEKDFLNDSINIKMNFIFKIEGRGEECLAFFTLLYEIKKSFNLLILFEIDTLPPIQSLGCFIENVCYEKIISPTSFDRIYRITLSFRVAEESISYGEENARNYFTRG